MTIVGIILIYLAFAKEFEPLLLYPIAFGCILANLPKNGFEEGVFALIHAGIQFEIFPPLIFMGVGVDDGLLYPLLANPKTLLLGAKGTDRCFRRLWAARCLLGFTAPQVAAIGIIGGADHSTSIYLASKLAPELLGAIAVAAYSYMSSCSFDPAAGS